MAKKVTVTLVDDIDHGPADETVEFGLDGKNYSIDLSAANAKALRAALEPYVGSAEVVARRRKAARGSDGQAAQIRAWARSVGRDVPSRGRIPADLRMAYENAN